MTGIQQGHSVGGHSTSAGGTAPKCPPLATGLVMGRESDGMISLTFGVLERSDQGQLLKNRVSMRDSARVTIEH